MLAACSGGDNTPLPDGGSDTGSDVDTGGEDVAGDIIGADSDDDTEVSEPFVELSFDASSLDFGSVALGAIGTETVRLANAGNVDADSIALRIEGDGFALTTAAEASIAAGANRSIGISFSPDEEGEYSAELVANFGDEELRVSLSGMGVELAGPADLELRSDGLAFGEVPVGTSTQLNASVSNVGGEATTVTVALSGDAAFGALPPSTFELGPGASVGVPVAFAPTGPGTFDGELTLSSPEETLTVTLRGESSESTDAPRIQVEAVDVDFGATEQGTSTSTTVRISNVGDGVATINGATVIVDGSSANIEPFFVNELFPLTIAPGDFTLVTLEYSPSDPGRDTGRVVFDGELGVDVTQATLDLAGFGYLRTSPAVPGPDSVAIPGTETRADNLVDASNSTDAQLTVTLPDTVRSGDRVRVEVEDEDASIVASEIILDSRVSEVVLPQDLSALTDGRLILRAWVERGTDDEVGPIARGVATKWTGLLDLPILDPEPATFTSADALRLTGTGPLGSRIVVTGGSTPVSGDVADGDGTFDILVPLRRNTVNTLAICATRSGGSACLAPISIAHLVPDEIIDASVSSRRLDTDEVEALVESGVIDLDDPDNFHVSEFSICLVLGEGSTDLCEEDYVVVPNSPGTGGVYYGSRAGRAGPGGRGGRVFVAYPPGVSEPMVGLVRINGRIKTLKEFFQVTFVLANSSDTYAYEDVLAELITRDGVTAIRAGLGEDVVEIEVDGPIDSVPMGTIGPSDGSRAAVSTAQFVVRGDVAGEHRLDIRFSGAITGDLIPEPIVYGGQVTEEIEVLGPPELGVDVFLPPEFEFGEAYPIRIRITNLSPIPALYASVEVDLDPNLYPIDPLAGCFDDISANTGECCGAIQTVGFDLGHLDPGESEDRVVDAISCITGPVTACQFAADENLSMQVVTGVECPGESIPIERADPLEFAPPTVIEYGPTGVVEASDPPPVRIRLSGDVVGISVDSLTDIERDAEGITNATILPTGSVFIDRMGDSLSLGRVPAELRVSRTEEDTLIELFPGIEGWGELEPGYNYRVTVRGGAAGIRTGDTGESLPSSFVWTFSTVGEPVGETLRVESVTPANGATEVSRFAAVYLDFSEQIDFSSLAFGESEVTDNSIALVADPVIVDGSIADGTFVSARLTGGSGSATLVLSPQSPFEPDTTYGVWVGNVTDIYGHTLDAPFSSTFRTVAAAPLPLPITPRVEPLPRWTSTDSVLVTGYANRGEVVTVSGGSTDVSVRATSSGTFAALVSLEANEDHDLSVVSENDDGVSSDVTTVDTAGDPLRIGRDLTAPVVSVDAPVDGATVSGLVEVEWSASDPFGPGVSEARLTSAGVELARIAADPAESFEIDTTRYDNGTHSFAVSARDLVGNWSSDVVVELTLDNPIAPRIDAVSPTTISANSTATMVIMGRNFTDTPALTFDAPGIEVLDLAGDENELTAELSIAADTPVGLTELTITTAGGSATSTDAGVTITVGAPRPVITSLSPSESLAGPDPITIEVLGGGFLPSSEILYGEPPTAAPTTFVSGERLTAELPAGALNFATNTDIPIIVRTPDMVRPFVVSNQLTLQVLAEYPQLTLESTTIDIGDVLVGDFEVLGVGVTNTGVAALTLREFEATNGFRALDTSPLTLAEGQSVVLPVRFDSTREGTSTDELVFQHNDPVFDGGSGQARVALSANGIADSGTPSVGTTPTSIDFGPVELATAESRTVTLENMGDGIATIESISFESLAGTPAPTSAYSVAEALPITIGPGDRKEVRILYRPVTYGADRQLIRFMGPGVADAGVAVEGEGARPPVEAALMAPTFVRVPAGPDRITATNVSSVVVEVGVPDSAQIGDTVTVDLVDRNGFPISASATLAVEGDSIDVTVDASDLVDGPINLIARFERDLGGDSLRSDRQLGLAVKSTSTLEAPVVSPTPAAITAADSVTVEGTGPEGVDIVVYGGADQPAMRLGFGESAFALPTLLKRNQQNILVVCAERDDERACAAPISVAHLVFDEIIGVTTSSRRLTAEEVAILVAEGVIDLDDPDNFHVSEFEICLEYGGDGHITCYSEPVVLPNGPGGDRVHVYSTGEGAPGGPSEATIIVVQPPSGPPMGFVIEIENRIKTLKEFFQIRVVATNSAPGYAFEDMIAQLVIPEGMTAIRAGGGADIDDIEVDGPIDEIGMGTLLAAADGTPTFSEAQFVVRGDVAGTYDLTLWLDGLLVGAGLGDGIPVSVSAIETLDVVGPPELEVEVIIPNDMDPGQPYPIRYRITNPSPVPALYASLEVGLPAGFVYLTDPPYAVPTGCESEPADAASCCGRPYALEFDLDHLEPGETVERIVEGLGCFDDNVTACAFVADENLSVSVEPGVDCPGSYRPIERREPSAAMPPIVLLTTPDAHASLEVAGLNITAEVSGVVSGVRGDIVTSDGVLPNGSVYLERLSPSGDRVRERVAAAVSASTNSDGNTRIVVTPTTPLRGESVYRVTLLGGVDGLRDVVSGAPMLGDYQWTFSTRAIDNGLPISVVSATPEDGSSAVSLYSSWTVSLSEPLGDEPLDLTSSDYSGRNIALVEGGTIAAGDVSGGTAVDVSVSMNASRTQLFITPILSLDQASTYTLRVASLVDRFGDAQTSPFVTSVTTITGGPAVPVGPPSVEALPRFVPTREVTVSGLTAPYANVTITDSRTTESTEVRANGRGRFSTPYPLPPNENISLSLISRNDLGEPTGATPARLDVNGDALTTAADLTPPSLAVLSPGEDEVVTGLVTFELDASDPFGPGVDSIRVSANGVVVAQAFGDDVDRVDVNTTTQPTGSATFRVWARDGVGNWSSAETRIVELDNSGNPRIVALTPDQLVVGGTSRVYVSGNNLDSVRSAFVEPFGTVVGVPGLASGDPGAPADADLFVDIQLPTDTSPTPLALSLSTAEIFASPDPEDIVTASDEVGVSLYAVAAPLVVGEVTPSQVEVSEDPLTFTLSGSGFGAGTEVIAIPGDIAMETEVMSATELEFTTPAGLLSDRGGRTFLLRTPNSIAPYAYSESFGITVTRLELAWAATSTEIAGGQTSFAELRLVDAHLDDVDATLSVEPVDAGVSVPATAFISRGETSTLVPIDATAALSGTSIVIRAGASGSPDALLSVDVVEAPAPSLSEASYLVQPAISVPVNVLLDGPAPASGLGLVPTTSAELALEPAPLRVAGGAVEETFQLTASAAGDFEFELETVPGRSTGIVPVSSRQVLLTDSPAEMRPGSADNDLAFRVSTNGTDPIGTLRVYVPAHWSLESATIDAIRGDGSRIDGAAISVGEYGAGAGATTEVTINAVGVDVGDSEPWIDLTFTDVLAVLPGSGVWEFEVDGTAAEDEPSLTVDHPPISNAQCIAWGTTHFRSFDDLAYDIQGAGEWRMVFDPSDSFEVQLRQEPLLGSELASEVSAVAIQVGTSTIQVEPGGFDALLVNGVAESTAEVARSLDGGALISASDGYYVGTAGGDMVYVHEFGTRLDVEVYVRASRETSVRGLCANFDGDPGDDVLLPDDSSLELPVNVVDLYERFIHGWRVDEVTSLFTYEAGEGPDTYFDADHPADFVEAADLTAEDADPLVAQCELEGVTEPFLLAACVIDAYYADVATGAAGTERVRTPLVTLGLDKPLLFYRSTQTGPSRNGDWAVSADYASVYQSTNGDPTFFVSAQDYINVIIEGTMTVEGGDNDMIGFVFGYRSPLDTGRVFDTYLFDWKGGRQDIAEEGFALSYVQGDYSSGWGDWWGRETNLPRWTTIATDYGSSRGWNRLDVNEFRLIHTPTRVEIWMNGERIFQERGEFQSGRFGFYNYSQPGVRYADFSVQDIGSLTLCGDAFLDSTEECDDGNNEPGDGCTADCTLETCPGDPGSTYEVLFTDADDDGYAVLDTASVLSCEPVEGFAPALGDCNDTEPLSNPGLGELCRDLIDNDCDPETVCTFCYDTEPDTDELCSDITFDGPTPVAYYTLDDASLAGGTAVDVASPRYDATFDTDSVTGGPGVVAESFDVSGAEGGLQASPPQNGVFSAALWIRPAAYPDTQPQTLLAQGDGPEAETGWRLSLETDGTLSMTINPGAPDEVVASTVTPVCELLWRHVLVTYDGTQVRIYENGTLAAETDVPVGVTLAFGSGVFAVADSPQLTGDAFGGEVDEILLWDAALTPADALDAFGIGYCGFPVIPVDLTPLASCMAWRDAGATVSGLYSIDPDGTGGEDEFLVFCDMVREGGGWTLVSIDEKGERPDSWTGNAYPRPGASHYGDLGQVVGAIATIEAGGDPALNYSIDAALLYESSNREFLAYVGDATRSYIYGGLPLGCNFFDGSTFCMENTYTGITVYNSDGSVLTADAQACTTAARTPPFDGDSYDEFGLNLIDGVENNTRHCHLNTTSTLGHQNVGRIYTTFNASSGSYWSNGVHSHFDETGVSNSPGYLMIR